MGEKKTAQSVATKIREVAGVVDPMKPANKPKEKKK